jgi:hypothetical protein
MRLPRMSLQQQMVALAFVGIALFALIELGPDVRRRWRECHWRESGHAQSAQRYFKVVATAKPGGSPRYRERVEDFRKRAVNEARLSRQYSYVWLRPWRLYTMVD